MRPLHPNDLILGKSASPHHASPADELTYQWHDFWGARHRLSRQKAYRREPIACDSCRSRDRNRNGRTLDGLKHQRHIANRYDKTALSLASVLNRAAIRGWLPECVNRP